MTPAPAASARRWEHFDHGADIGVRGHGPSKEAAFEEAARALTAVVADVDAVRPNSQVMLDCRGADDGALLVAWLNAVVYAMATRRMLFSRFEVRFEGDRLYGSAWGESIDRERHQPAVEVKGATYTALAVERGAGGDWTARCVVDV